MIKITLAALAAGAALSLPSAPAVATTNPSMDICNSPASYTWIEAFSTRPVAAEDTSQPRWLAPGVCTGYYHGDEVRVNVNGWGSYRYDPIGDGLGYLSCHEAPNGAANPPNYNKVWVKTYKLNCDGSTPVIPKP